MNPFLRFTLLQNAAGAEGGAGGGGAGGSNGNGGGAGGAGGAGGGNDNGAGAGGANGGGDGKGGAGDGKGGVPESYTFAKVKQTTKGADGKEVVAEVDPPADIAKEVAEFAKANGYTQAQAQALLDRELKLIADANVADEKARAEGLAALKKAWQDATRADKDFAGADGQQFDANMAIAKRALEKFFPDVAKEADKHPFLDHPQVLKGLLNIGKLISPDGEFIAGRGNDTPRDPAKTLFPNMA